jgi:HSP20 family protein
MDLMRVTKKNYGGAEMSLVRYNPERRLTSLRDNINRIFDMTFPTEWGDDREFAQWRPSVDMYEKDGEMVVHAELPGVKKEDISLDMNDSVMTIKGKRKSEEEIEEDGYYRKERRFGSFQRSIPLPEAIDPEQVKANYRDGVLEIRIPQSESAGMRQISID